ncbi:hypothetical protein JRO89_XS09G0032100 [Xanthoceras sorbifolium]|uniref:Uncharacterized protein n=1 Tax=Xanthoceras sorbifolium TaxID=99658 RepID=A0ABQ8HKG7_9ROSI|nr:hypothetical protein JRO89_XS09G0032100 [Xanthoceras sorbifolium]
MWVGNRIIRKRSHVRVEHVEPSRCKKELKLIIIQNDELKAEAKARDEKISTKDNLKDLSLVSWWRVLHSKLLLPFPTMPSMISKGVTDMYLLRLIFSIVASFISKNFMTRGLSYIYRPQMRENLFLAASVIPNKLTLVFASSTETQLLRKTADFAIDSLPPAADTLIKISDSYIDNQSLELRAFIRLQNQKLRAMVGLTMEKQILRKVEEKEKELERAKTVRRELQEKMKQKSEENQM